MPNPEIEEFAKILVKHVRDAAISLCDLKLDEESMGPGAKRWRKLAPMSVLKPIAEAIIPDIVDNTIGQLMWAIDQGLLPITFTASNGRAVDLNKEGLSEMLGWYIGGDGWRDWYSKERFVDDFAGLKLDNEIPPVK